MCYDRHAQIRSAEAAPPAAAAAALVAVDEVVVVAGGDKTLADTGVAVIAAREAVSSSATTFETTLSGGNPQWTPTDARRTRSTSSTGRRRRRRPPPHAPRATIGVPPPPPRHHRGLVLAYLVVLVCSTLATTSWAAMLHHHQQQQHQQPQLHHWPLWPAAPSGLHRINVSQQVQMAVAGSGMEILADGLQQQQQQRQQLEQHRYQQQQYQQHQAPRIDDDPEQQEQESQQFTVLYTTGHFSSADRPFRIVNRTLQSALDVFARSEFAIMAKLRQEPGSVATILSLGEPSSATHGTTPRRLLEVQSSARRAEVRVFYSDASGDSQVAVFPNAQLADGRWHQVALRFSGDELALFVDCTRLGARMLHGGRTQPTNNSQLLLLGQPEAYAFRGDVEYVQLASGPNVLQRLQCPLLDGECPTCAQFQLMRKQHEEKIARLLVDNQQLKRRVEQLSLMMFSIKDSLETFERFSMPHCWPDGRRVENGTRWREGCNECTCVNKEITCSRVQCPSRVDCSDPELDTCCQASCGRNCSDGWNILPHSTVVYKRSHRGCVVATCNSGVLSFRNESCAPLPCPETDHIFEEGACCATCRRDDHCGTFEGICAEHATCVGHGFSAKCLCNEGYAGEGRVKCEDIDECGSETLHHCPANSVCINLPGNYSCHCREGFTTDARGFCVDVDECLEKNFCDASATCVNTIGSYECRCPPGYRSEGRACKPECGSACEHGGICVAPGRCECRRGYRGSLCQYDVDECSEGLDLCGPHATCTNLPGWYSCQCEPGFQPMPQVNGSTLCVDVDECVTGQHSCPLESECVNEPGSYACVCPDEGLDEGGLVSLSSAGVFTATSTPTTTPKCSPSCRVTDHERGWAHIVPNGSYWIDEHSCTSCTCRQGAAKCQPLECGDCSAAKASQRCCPHCFQNDEAQCRIRNEQGTLVKLIANGQRYTHGCQICECVFGQLDCWTSTCPRLNCSSPQFPPDLCCPICVDQDPCAPLGPLWRSDSGRPPDALARRRDAPEDPSERACHQPADSLFSGTLPTPLGRVAPCKGCRSEAELVLYNSVISTTTSSYFSHDKRSSRRSLHEPEHLFQGVEKYFISCVLLVLVAVILTQQVVLGRRQRSTQRRTSDDRSFRTPSGRLGDTPTSPTLQQRPQQPTVAATPSTLSAASSTPHQLEQGVRHAYPPSHQHF